MGIGQQESLSFDFETVPFVELGGGGGYPFPQLPLNPKPET